MSTSAFLVATVVAFLLIADGVQSEDDTTEHAMPFDTCPCLPSVVCPHAFGSNPEDEMYFGTILKCEKPEDVRCCGVSTSVVTSKAILPVNLPEEYQVRVEPSPAVTVLPMDVVTPETTVETEVEIAVTETLPTATTNLYKHDVPQSVGEVRTARFSAEEIEAMKQRLRDVLRKRSTPDLVFEESRFRKVYQSTEATTTTSSTTTTTRRSRFSTRDVKKEPTTTVTPAVEVRPQNVLMHKFDTRNRQNFLKSGKTTTTTTTTTAAAPVAFEDDEDGDTEKDVDVAETSYIKEVVEPPSRPFFRGRMRYGMTSTTTPRPRKQPKEEAHAMKMTILDDINHQISEKRGVAEDSIVKPNDFKMSPPLDFYFEREDEAAPAQVTTERSNRAQPVFESGFEPMMFK